MLTTLDTSHSLFPSGVLSISTVSRLGTVRRAQHMRKNIYEEALFRSEDDRFELDMVIECGASAIRAMKPLVAQLAGLQTDVKANWRLPQVRWQHSERQQSPVSPAD